MKKVEFYHCEKCGNVVVKVTNGGGTLACCGENMRRLEPNVKEAALEKHVPEIRKEGGKIIATIGSVLHPMLPEHYIEWIALVDDKRADFKFLEPGEDPIAEFDEVEHGTIYEYCNIHGFWKKDF